MAHVVTVAPEPFLACDGRARVTCLPAASDNLVWVLECVATGQAAVVDGPPDPGLLAALDALDNTVVAVLNTHTHPDHIGVNRLFAEAGRLDALTVYGPAGAAAPIPGLDVPVDEGSQVRLGELVLDVWRTDGHQNGHVVYRTGDLLFCGDTLFTGGCGYLFDGPPAAMFRSLMRLAELPGDTRVCCAHEYTVDNLRFAAFVEPENEALVARLADVLARRERGECVVPSQMAEEQATNPFLRPGSPELIARLAALDALDSDRSPGAVFAATRALKNTGRHRTAE